MQPILNRSEAVQRLRQKGLSPTAQRVEVLYQLHQSMDHLTPEALHERVNGEYGRASRATVYNTLHMLKAYGLVREVVVAPGRVLYDANTDPHHHVLDVDTGEVRDLPADHLALAAMPPLESGERLVGVEVLLRVSKQATQALPPSA